MCKKRFFFVFGSFVFSIISGMYFVYVHLTVYAIEYALHELYQRMDEHTFTHIVREGKFNETKDVVWADD